MWHNLSCQKRKYVQLPVKCKKNHTLRQRLSDASRRLRSSDTFTFAMPRTRTRLGDRSFAVAGPHIWNSLPADLRLVDNYARFRRLLKGHVWLRLWCLVTVIFGRRVQIYSLTHSLSSTLIACPRCCALLQAQTVLPWHTAAYLNDV